MITGGDLRQSRLDVGYKTFTISPWGMAKLLVSSAEQWAKDHGLKELYLLTTTASEFFNALGYDVVVRNEVPQQIKETTQFSQLCPCSSLVMNKQI